MKTEEQDNKSGKPAYPVGEVRTQSGVAAEPLVSAVITFLNDVAGDHAAAVAGGRLPGQCDRRLDLIAEVWVQRRAWSLCSHNTKGPMKLD